MKRTLGQEAELEGLLNLWDLITLCALTPRTNGEAAERLKVQEAGTRRMRRKARARFGIEFRTVEVEREGRIVPAFTTDLHERDKLESRFAALGA